MRLMLPRRRRYLVKFGILMFIAGGIFAIILELLQLVHWPDELDLLGENFIDLYSNEDYTLGLLRDDITPCLTGKWKKGSASQNKDLNVTNTDIFSTFKTNDNNHHPKSYELLIEFNSLLTSANTKAAIIEPSILYCMLQKDHQDLLTKRHFDVASFSRSPNIVTYGILYSDALKLKQEENVDKFTNAGFKPFFVHTPTAAWMLKLDANPELQTSPSHLFYIHENCIFHLVVFYKRQKYIWHAGLNTEEKEIVPLKKGFLFASYNGAYEKFTFISLKSKSESLANFYIPSSPQYFLFQMLSSRFIECNASRAANITDAKSHPKTHTLLSVERFNLRTLTVIHQFKAIFHPLLINIWLFSGTMLGWYRQCDIIPYTTDVDFAAWAEEVDDVDNLIKLLRHNKYIDLTMRMGKKDEGLEFQMECKRLRTDIFFMYRTENGTWCAGHSPKLGYYFRYYYPHFTLCSAELLGEKVQVACETEKLIVSEYGPDWSKPVSSWSYEKSVGNRGPNIYWSKQKLKDAYEAF